MEISDDLKNRLLDIYERDYKERLKAIIHPKSSIKYTKYPIRLDGVMDWIRYNNEEQRFDQLEITIAIKPIAKAEWMGGESTAVYCDKFGVAVIPL